MTHYIEVSTENIPIESRKYSNNANRWQDLSIISHTIAPTG